LVLFFVRMNNEKIFLLPLSNHLLPIWPKKDSTAFRQRCEVKGMQKSAINCLSMTIQDPPNSPLFVPTAKPSTWNKTAWNGTAGIWWFGLHTRHFGYIFKSSIEGKYIFIYAFIFSDFLFKQLSDQFIFLICRQATNSIMKHTSEVKEFFMRMSFSREFWPNWQMSAFRSDSFFF
jgi:hypothetical protein